MSSEGMAAQFTSMNGAFARSLFSCKALATSSFPVPFSPVIRTRASVGATLSIIFLIFVMGSDSPIILPVSSTFLRSRLVSLSSVPLSSAFLTVTRSRFRSSGFAI